jgi:hypothetical protein
VPQALQGTLHAAALDTFENGEIEERGKKKKRRPVTVDDGLKSLFTGFGLFIIFLLGIFAFRGAFWVTIWFIIPALANIGEGIGQLIRARQDQARLLSPPNNSGGDFRPAAFAPAPPAVAAQQLPSADTREIIGVPASVTDNTTRHLDAPSQTP